MLPAVRCMRQCHITGEDVGNRSNIICNGAHIETHDSLVYALKRSRLKSAPRFVWADALCINQTDLNEKTTQVMRMREIYRRAHVVNSLGELHDSELDTGVLEGYELLSNAHHDFEHIANVSPAQTLKATVTESRKTALVCTDKLPWLPMYQLLGHLYFTRVWIIQEIQWAWSAEIHVGHSAISLVRLLEALQMMKFIPIPRSHLAAELCPKTHVGRGPGQGAESAFSQRINRTPDAKYDRPS